MRRFCQLVLALIGILVLTAGTSYFVSTPQSPADPMLLLFTNPDGTACKGPCLFGVRPGETSYAAALVLLRTHPLTHDFEFDLKHGTLRGPEARVILHVEAGKPLSQIDLVRTTTGSRMPWGTLGGMVTSLLAPDWASINSDFTVSYYLADHLVFHHSHHAADRIGLDDQAEEVAVYAELPRIPLGAMPWLGFSAVRRYLPSAGPVQLRTGIMIDLTPGCSLRSTCRIVQ